MDTDRDPRVRHDYEKLNTPTLANAAAKAILLQRWRVRSAECGVRMGCRPMWVSALTTGSAPEQQEGRKALRLAIDK